MQASLPTMDIDFDLKDRGYHLAHAAAKKFYGDFLWTVGNLPRNQRFHLDTLLHHGMRVADLLDLESVDGSTLDIWNEIRQDIDAALQEGQFASPVLAALADTIQKYEISSELIVEPLLAADDWIRRRQFETFDELSEFVERIGGSTMQAAVPVLGYVKPGYETASRACGVSVVLTQMLVNFVNDSKQNKIFLARADLDECEIVMDRIKMRQFQPELKHLVRLYCWRIEKILTDGAKLVSFLDFDGRRSITSLLALNWRLLTQMKREPESLLNEEGVLSRRDWFGLRSRHLLGLEGKVPIIDVPAETVHH